MCIYIGNNEIMRFNKVSSGAYLYEGKSKMKNKNVIHKQSYLSTVDENKVKSSKRQVIMANEARDLYVKLDIRGMKKYSKH